MPQRRLARYEDLFPDEMGARMRRFPVAFVPFGTLEWHAHHLVLGNDAVKTEALTDLMAKKTGGVALPPTYWAVGGLTHPWTCRLDKDVVERLFFGIFEQLDQVGFRVIIAMTGHYPQEQVLALKRAAMDFNKRHSATAWALPEYEVTTDLGYGGDHAGKWETSLLWALRPELVNMAALKRKDGMDGVGGEDPRVHASRALGRKMADRIVTRCSQLARRLLKATTPRQRMAYLATAAQQIHWLERSCELRARGRYVKSTKAYMDMLDRLWRGRYPEALELGRQAYKDLVAAAEKESAGR